MIRSKYQEIIFWIVIILSIVAGLYFRLKGLGKWPLAVDEYYIVKSSENILKHGLPMWDGGGYYARGIPQQYLTALLLLLGLKAEFASRIIPAIVSLFSFPALYLIGKKISGKTLAAALIFIFAFSIWQIEFARFARMYSLFQTIFIWYLYFLYNYVFEGDSRSIKWVWLFSLFSIFVYEASIFLAILNFVPIIWDKNKSAVSHPVGFRQKNNFYNLAAAITILAAAYSYLSFDFRTLGQENLLPKVALDYFNSAETGGDLRLPTLLMSSLTSNIFWGGLFLLLLLFNFIWSLKIIPSESSIIAKFSVVVIITFSLLNLLGLVAVSFVIFILLGWLNSSSFNLNSEEEKNSFGFRFAQLSFIKFLLPVLILNFIYWSVYSFASDAWYYLLPQYQINNHFSAFKFMLKEAINYPYFYETFALFRDTIPGAAYLNLFLIVLLIFFTVLKQLKQNDNSVRFFLTVFLILIILQNILNLTYFDTRYFFFLYSLLLILNLLSIERMINYFSENKLITKVIFSLSILLYVLISEDFKIDHMINIDSKDVNFRNNLSLPLKIHYYPRWDTKTLSDIINSQGEPDDIVITNEHTSDHYLKRLDYIFRDYKGTDFKGESILSGKRERWTNAKLIYSYAALNSFIDNSSGVIWLIINSMWSLDELKSLVKKYDKFLYAKGLDGNSYLFKISSHE